MANPRFRIEDGESPDGPQGGLRLYRRSEDESYLWLPRRKPGESVEARRYRQGKIRAVTEPLKPLSAEEQALVKRFT